MSEFYLHLLWWNGSTSGLPKLNLAESQSAEQMQCSKSRVVLVLSQHDKHRSSLLTYLVFLKLILDLAGKKKKGHWTQICSSDISLPAINRNPIQFYSDCTEQPPPLPSWQKNTQNSHFPKLPPRAAAESHLCPALLPRASLPQRLHVLRMLFDSPGFTRSLR